MQPTQTSVTIAPVPQPLAPQQIEQPKRRLTAKVKTAIDAMVWQALKRDEAAQLAGLKDNSLYVALSKPEARSYYLAQCEVLRLSGRARRIHRLEAMVEQDDNKAAVINAALALDRIDSIEQSSQMRHQSPGFVIQVINQPAPLSASQREINAKPLIDHASGSSEPAALPHQGDADR